MHGELFLVYKLASMTDTRNILGQLLPDEQRLFPLGRLLRKYGIDELPQILNILKGEMSWIGPRPLLPYYTKHYTTRQAKRLFVRPGLSGWAQVHGRNTLNWEEKLELDAWYAEHCSLALDLQILGMTLAQFLTGKLQQDTRLEQPWQTDQISTANTDKN